MRIHTPYVYKWNEWVEFNFDFADGQGWKLQIELRIDFQMQ